MAYYIFANNVSTTLASPITSATQTTITLSSSANLPTIGSGQILALTLNDAATQSVFEIVYATARSGATLTVIRGEESTAATTWLAGDYIYAAVTAVALENIPQVSTLVTLNDGLDVNNAATIAGGGVNVALNTTTNGYLEVGGNTFAANLVMDPTSIQARNDGSSSALLLNPLGGAVQLYGSGISIPILQRGTANISIPSGQPGATLLVNFPFAFATRPYMNVTLSTSSGSSQGITTAAGLVFPVTQAYSVSTAYFFIEVQTPNATNATAAATISVDWYASSEGP